MASGNVANFCKHLLDMAIEKYGEPMETECEDVLLLESNVRDVLLIIEDLTMEGSIISTIKTLDLDTEGDFDYEDDCLESFDFDSPNSEQMSQEWEELKIDKQVYSLDVMKNVVAFYDNCKNNKFKQTASRYKFIKYPQTITRFREYISKCGRKMDKLKQLEEYVAQRFTDARRAYASVSERDLMRWGIRKARELELDFKASRFWVHTFKKSHRIVSRKITKLTTRKEIIDLDQVKEAGKAFVQEVKDACANVPSKCIWNFDQSGFNYGHSKKRTLSEKGEKDTTMVVDSMNAVSHSYSIMPIVSMDGKLADKLLVCLQETGGSFGPRVSKGLNVPKNIYLTCSKSGKLDKSIMTDWVAAYVSKMTPDEIMALLFDSWTIQKDPVIYKPIQNLHGTFILPPKTTQWRQPLDNYFFRQYKIIKRRICDRVLLEDVDIDLNTRQNVVIMQSLIYNQFQSSAFEPMIRYSWFKCGYTDNRAGHFLNVTEALFDVEEYECDHEDCEDNCFIRCSHCKSYLCINHFLLSNHFHDV